MTYLRSLFLNFLIVFFVNHVMPGIKVESFQNAPNIGADILFAAVVGFLNASIFPVFVLFEINITFFRMSIIAFIISCIAYITIAAVDIGVKALTWPGTVAAILIVWIVSSFSNYLEYKHSYHSR